MKKVLVVALMLGTGLAYAASLGVPWFVDNAATGTMPPAAVGAQGCIYINNTATQALEVTISYYTQTGVPIGPWTYNTFMISPKSSLGFLPCVNDTLYESTEAQKIPNRPTGTVDGNDNKKNGSLSFSWMTPSGGGSLCGAYALFQTISHANSPTDTTQVYMMTGYGHLLPSGS